MNDEGNTPRSHRGPRGVRDQPDLLERRIDASSRLTASDADGDTRSEPDGDTYA
jgi:hypothetical protein